MKSSIQCTTFIRFQLYNLPLTLKFLNQICVTLKYHIERIVRIESIALIDKDVYHYSSLFLLREAGLETRQQFFMLVKEQSGPLNGNHILLHGLMMWYVEHTDSSIQMDRQTDGQTGTNTDLLKRHLWQMSLVIPYQYEPVTIVKNNTINTRHFSLNHSA